MRARSLAVAAAALWVFAATAFAGDGAGGATSDVRFNKGD